MRLYRFHFKNGNDVEIPLESINLSRTGESGITGTWVEAPDSTRIEVIKWSEVVMVTSRPVVATHPYRGHARHDAPGREEPAAD